MRPIKKSIIPGTTFEIQENDSKVKLSVFLLQETISKEYEEDGQVRVMFWLVESAGGLSNVCFDQYDLCYIFMLILHNLSKNVFHDMVEDAHE